MTYCGVYLITNTTDGKVEHFSKKPETKSVCNSRIGFSRMKKKLRGRRLGLVTPVERLASVDKYGRPSHMTEAAIAHNMKRDCQDCIGCEHLTRDSYINHMNGSTNHVLSCRLARSYNFRCPDGEAYIRQGEDFVLQEPPKYSGLNMDKVFYDEVGDMKKFRDEYMNTFDTNQFIGVDGMTYKGLQVSEVFEPKKSPDLPSTSVDSW